MSDVVKVEITVKTNKIGSKASRTIDFDKEVWEEMTHDDKEEVCRETMQEMIEWDWNEINA